MLASEDTIVAVATPPGQGGVGIVRVSGPYATPIALALFHPTRRHAVLQPRRLVHGILRDPSTHALLDEALVCLMPSPHSFTGQDIVEFQCHGSPATLERVTTCCLRLGARLAERGEFTLRAFLHGRIDLAQAEAVMALVGARTETAAQVAAQAAAGALNRALQPLVDTVTGALAYLEATIDFVEDDLPQQAMPALAESVNTARQGLDRLLQRAGHGALLQNGLRVVLAGKPNVGKSSLLNALLRRDRAIVTAVAGTTRDTLEEAADIHGLPMFLIDTAGLAESLDPVERLGIARSGQALRSADLVAMVVDASEQPTDDDARAVAEVHAAAPQTPIVLVCNKADRTPALPSALFEAFFPSPPSKVVRCSALDGQGIADLEDALADLALGGQALDAEATLVENSRQRRALESAATALHVALDGMHAGRAAELICIDLRSALEALGAVTGMNVGEAVLDRIFSDFCIGK